MIITGITVDDFKAAVALAGENYEDNLKAEIGTVYSQTRFNARVLPVHTGYQLYGKGTRLAPGQKRSWQGRRVNAVCWHVYRDVLLHAFHTNPNARVRTMYAKYRGIQGFLQEYPRTASINVGSMMQPTSPVELCDCSETGHVAPPAFAAKPLQHTPTREEQEMIDWWAGQADRIRARRTG